MPEDLTKRLQVTFKTGLPMGTRATFTHDKQTWIAYPLEKNRRIFEIMDRLIGIHTGITKEMVGWINRRPGDTELVNAVLERTTQARILQQELVIDKIKAVTQ